MKNASYSLRGEHGLAKVYTEELGWIDLGHAQGQDARILKRKLEQEHFSTYYDEFHDWYFPVDYHQEMGIRKKY